MQDDKLKMEISKIENSIKFGLKTIAASFPVAASFAQAWSEYESRVQFDRIQRFFDDFGHELDAIKDRVEKAETYIKESGEVPSQIEKTVDKIRKEVSDRKRQIYAHLLSNLVTTHGTLTYDDKINFIDSLEALTEQDLTILFLFKPDQQLRVKDAMNSPLLKDLSGNESLNKLAVSLSKLESRGLISEAIGPADQGVMAKIYDSFGWQEKFKDKYFELLPHGLTFMKLTFETGV
jgi:hypothetical protein